MPTYDYKCFECGFKEEVFQKMTDAHLTQCPKCRKSSYKRLIGSGGIPIFKGSGFYQTDYKNNSKNIKNNSHRNTPEKSSSKKSSEEKKPSQYKKAD